ncbi:MAG: DUF177 domain-containing protein [Clostridia bacterium]
MLIDITKASKGVLYDIEVELPFKQNLLVDPMAKFVSPCKAYANYVVEDNDDIIFNAVASVEIEYPCSRCLKPTKVTVKFKVAECYKYNGEDKFSYSSNEFDISTSIEEAFCLEQPNKVVCKPDCKGLCPKCGANLNKIKCKCVVDNAEQIESQKESPFAILKEMNFNTGGAKNGITKK